MSNPKKAAYLTPGHKLFEIFPDGAMPIVYLLPIDIEGCPSPCYIIDGKALTQKQVSRLADDLITLFPDLFRDRRDAENAVSLGFPMMQSHFSGVLTDDLDIMSTFMDVPFPIGEEDDDPYNYGGSDE
jgi:hypothetical protein